MIQNGDCYRLTSPQTDEAGAWAFVSEDKKEVLFNAVMIRRHGNMTVNYVKLQGLDPDKIYHVSRIEEDLYGDELLWYGLDVSDASSGENREEYNGRNGDYQSKLFLLSSIE